MYKTIPHNDALKDSGKHCRRLGEGLAQFFSLNVLVNVMKHTLFRYMSCPECAPAEFAHTPLLLKPSCAFLLQGILSSGQAHPYTPGYTHQVFWHVFSHSYTATHSNMCLLFLSPVLSAKQSGAQKIASCMHCVEFLCSY